MSYEGEGGPIQRLRALLRQAGVDCAAVGPTTTLRYLLGRAPHADERLTVLLVGAGEAQLVIPELNAEGMPALPDVELLTWSDDRGPGEALARTFPSRGAVERLAVDESMRSGFLLPLLSAFSPRRVVPLDPIVAPLRIVKSPAEIDALAAAAALADRAMQAAVEACRPGASEAEVAWAAEESFRRGGAERVEFALAAAGANAASPHHSTGKSVLREGEGIILDIGASLEGYKSDITRVVHLGPPGEEFRKVFEIVLRANQAGVEAVRPGIAAESVDAAARGVIAEAGYGRWFIHRAGHGIGLDVHEPPWIVAGQRTVLEPGMVFSVEPGIYLPGRLGVRVEDIVVVGEHGPRVLTGFDHALVVR
jgi:Xaa-Pro aminopeptidase